MKMEIDNLTCELNMPTALKTTKSDDGTEMSHGLPPYERVDAYSVDEYLSCPDTWIHGSSKASSYFVPVEAGKGMWLDFNSCRHHKHHVAVVISIQGVNPVTGQKQNKMRLEQYKNKCPIHDVEFQQDRFCPDCKFKWPAQNYLSTTGTPGNLFWLDGFRSADGKVHQYIFTEEEIKGIAHQIIGEDKVYAIGIAFFLSKELKPELPQSPRLSSGPFDSLPWNYKPDGLDMFNPLLCIGHDNYSPKTYTGSNCISNSGKKTVRGSNPKQIMASLSSSSCTKGMTSALDRGESFLVSNETEIRREIEVQNLEIGAGASIKQQIYADPEDISFWQDEPASFIYVNYVDKKSVEKILAGGKREEKEIGFLEGLNVGN